MLAADGYGLLPVAEVELELIQQFACGKGHLDEFLRDVAELYHSKRLGLTSVVFHRDVEGIVGYFTLSNDAIRLNESEKFELDIQQDVEISFFPAVKLGRLAVAERLQGQGVGKSILDLVRGEVFDSTSRSAARFLITDADNDESVIRFYERNGFQRALFAESQQKRDVRAHRPRTVKMWLDVLATV